MGLKFKIAAVFLLARGLLSADPPPCTTGTLADYIALGALGCTFNGDVVANFSYAASATGGTTEITADQIMITPLVVVPAAAKLTFETPWSVDQDQTQESVIRYTVVPPPGGATPSQLQLTLGTARVAGIIGRVTVGESTNLGKLSVFTFCTEVCQIKATDSLAFDPVSVVLMRNHVSRGRNGRCVAYRVWCGAGPLPALRVAAMKNLLPQPPQGLSEGETRRAFCSAVKAG
jgi:hypothetical protein